MQKLITRFSFFLFLILLTSKTNSQVIISLLLGDKLNTGKVEFGLDGGISYSNLSGTGNSKTLSSFNLGFYFDIKTKSPNWLMHTGVMVKSLMGAKGIEPYPTGDASLDQLFIDGEVVRRLSYFNVPLELRYLLKSNFYMEGGVLMGLMYKASDEFLQEVNNKNDLSFKRDVRSDYHPLDIGPIAGIGYRFLKGNGINLRIQYYLGLIDVEVNDAVPNMKNRSFFVTAGIPIGVGKAKEREAAKQKN